MLRPGLGIAWMLFSSVTLAAAEDRREIPLAEGTPWETRAVVFRSGRPGPTVAVVAGIHGNEVAGWRAACQVGLWRVRKGRLVVLPRANALGLLRGTREVPGDVPHDLNRRFPSTPGVLPGGPLARDLWRLIVSMRPDWLLDLHESVDFRSRSTERRKRLGNTFVSYPSEETEAMAARLVQTANRLRPDSSDAKAWVSLRWPIEGSLARAAGKRLRSRAIIVETTRKDYLAVRVRYHRSIVHRLLVELRMLDEGSTPYAFFGPDREPDRIRVAIYNSIGTGSNSAWQLERCLRPHPRVDTRRITAAGIRSGALDRFDVVMFPGGTGSGTARALSKEGREAVRRFVSGGGGYLGVCAGAYLATTHYAWSLGILDSKVLDTAHWARGKGTVRMKLSAPGVSLFESASEVKHVRYGQGPLLAPGGDPRIPDFQILATYETEIAKNGAPKGVMVGTPAIVRGAFGRGRVLVSSPHPESSKDRSLRSYVLASTLWLAGANERERRQPEPGKAAERRLPEPWKVSEGRETER